jgi:sirohydrochlorin ferrochelatase
VTAAAFSLAFIGLCVTCLAYLHLAPTGYSPVGDAVSRYGVGRYARWYQAQATAAGLAAVALAVALGGPKRVVVLLALFAAARLAITQAPLDARPLAHWLLVALAFGSVTIAAIRLTGSEHGTPALGWTMAALLAVMTLTRRNPPLRRWFGLIERGFYVAMLAWLTLVAARLL